LVYSLKRPYEIFPCCKEPHSKNHEKITMKEWKEELENFKKIEIEIIDPQNKSTKALERSHKIRNIECKALRGLKMSNLERICSECYKNWDAIDAKIRSEVPKVPKCEYQPIRFSDPREISISKYFSCIRNIEQEEKIEKENKRVMKIYNKWIGEQKEL
jgi:hypothetical protein